ncbi:MAG: non-homologous end-joining DNA ligase [Eubacteriales bacterium]
MTIINVEGIGVNITNPNKILWPMLGITKIEYLKKLTVIADSLIKYTKGRLLTTIRYPDGVNNSSFFQKNTPNYAPKWIDTYKNEDKNYILLNKLATLIWLGNQGSLEFHISFNTINNPLNPSSLVFDLDPFKEQDFDEVIEVALLVHETLEQLHLKNYVKTSGATGLQIFIPLGNKYNYLEARNINAFFAKYFSDKYPTKITTERMIKNRGRKLYFDYLQIWEGKTIIAPYSPRGTNDATVSMPLTWEELKKGVRPKDFNLLNIEERLVKNDLFENVMHENNNEGLDYILEVVGGKLELK